MAKLNSKKTVKQKKSKFGRIDSRFANGFIIITKVLGCKSTNVFFLSIIDFEDLYIDKAIRSFCHIFWWSGKSRTLLLIPVKPNRFYENDFMKAAEIC